jgi:intein/homing endonuclease
MAKKSKIVLHLADPNSTPIEEIKKSEGGPSSPLVKSILNVLNGSENSIERLAFERDPSNNNEYAALYRAKMRLIPNNFLKRISIQDDLVASIITARSAQVSAFGRPQTDRFSTGFKIEFRPGVLDRLDPDAKSKLKERMDKAIEMFESCGHTTGWDARERMTLSQYLSMQARNALVIGWFATEIIHVFDPQDGQRKFHSFRPIDAGTIYYASPYKQAAESVRKQARLLLQQLKNERFDPERFENDEYAWIQVMESKPVQAFGPDECLVHTVYPVTDVELQGYPLSPIDTVIAAVTTHINITKHNRLYFENGRAAKGMLVITSDDVDAPTVERIRNQFNASINSVNNAWRMPVFGVGKQETIQFQPIESGGRDMEFQYLSDNNARVILSAFQMSPEELPGYAHLSRGTNNQALSECLHTDSEILTPEGQMSISEILGNGDSVSTKIWSGKEWVEGRVFRTGLKQITETVLNNGTSIKTSPDHKFRVIGEDGEPTWKTQSELSIGDHVLVNKTPVQGIGNIPEYIEGRPLTPEMMEVLGWITGDGVIQVNGETSHSLKLFYHHVKEGNIWNRHAAILKDFGLSPLQRERTISPEEAQEAKERYGFKSIAERRIWTDVNDTAFVRWLLSIGFRSSSEGKTIPSFIFSLPEAHRAAFLRGLFSADGGISKASGGSVILTAAHDAVRNGTRQLLMTLGIRTRFSTGTTKEIFVGNERVTVPANNKLYIKDKRAFFEKVGFLQDHKQPLMKWLDGNEASQKLPIQTQVKYARMLVDSNLPRAYKRNVYGFLTGKRRCTVQQLQFLLEKANIEAPSWFAEYHCEQVESLTTTDEWVEMADVTMYDDVHAFVANGIIVHNSNNEYKLEAARDVGIRPLLSHFQDFLNQRIFPLIDKELSDICYIRLIGLDAETPEKENVRIQQDAPLHMNFDEILQRVEKKHIGKKLGGKFPLNPQWQAIVDKYLPVGLILENFFDVQGASKDPQWQYVRDPMWFQWQQLQMQMKQMQMQEQQMQMQQQAMQQQQAQAQQQGQLPPNQGGQEGGQEPPPEGPQGGGGGSPAPQQQGEQAQGQPQQQEEQPLTRSIDQLQSMMSKAEHHLTNSQKETVAKQRKIVNHIMDEFEREKKAAIKDILDLATEHYEDVKDK